MVPIYDYDFDVLFWPSLFLAIYSVYRFVPKGWSKYRRYSAIFGLFIVFSIVIAGFMFFIRHFIKGSNV